MRSLPCTEGSKELARRYFLVRLLLEILCSFRLAIKCLLTAFLLKRWICSQTSLCCSPAKRARKNNVLESQKSRTILTRSCFKVVRSWRVKAGLSHAVLGVEPCLNRSSRQPNLKLGMKRHPCKRDWVILQVKLENMPTAQLHSRSSASLLFG